MDDWKAERVGSINFQKLEFGFRTLLFFIFQFTLNIVILKKILRGWFQPSIPSHMPNKCYLFSPE